MLRAPPGQVVDALQQQQSPDGPLLHSGDFWINPNPPHVWPQLHSNLPPPPNPAASYGWPGHALSKERQARYAQSDAGLIQRKAPKYTTGSVGQPVAALFAMDKNSRSFVVTILEKQPPHDDGRVAGIFMNMVSAVQSQEHSNDNTGTDVLVFHAA